MNKTTFQIWLLKENLGQSAQLFDALSEIGEVTSFSRLEEMIPYYNHKKTPDIVVTEYQLRAKNFIEGLSEWNHPHFFEKVPTVMISNMGCPKTIRGLFQRGLRDYFIAPISNTEIQIKVENILQNLDKYSHTAHYIRHGRKLISGLTKKESQIFQYFQSKKCQTATRSELQSYCWPAQSMTAQTLNVHIHNMRRKLYPHGLNIKGQKNGVWKLEEFQNRPEGSART